LNFFLIATHANDLITHFGKASRGDQTYIARANYTDIHGASSLLKFININVNTFYFFVIWNLLRFLQTSYGYLKYKSPNSDQGNGALSFNHGTLHRVYRWL
jgi:hypothetical protein